MTNRLSATALAVVVCVALAGLMGVAQSQSPADKSAPGMGRTPWGAPDLQGIWNAETLTPLQRPARFADKPVLTPDEAAKVEADVAGRPGRDTRSEPGSEKDVAKAYNQHWLPSAKRLADRRTGLIIDPPDGQVPEMTPEARKRTTEMREYLEALLQGTSGGRPGPVSPRRNDPPPMYNVDRINRSDGPEDRSTGERCFGVSLPYSFGPGSVNRIVQSPTSVAIYHDAQQGQGFARVIPTDGGPHLPASVRSYRGDARGRWDGDTLVVDTTNFSQKSDLRGSRENLHLIERFTRVGENRVMYRVTVEDPTTWVKPWTFEVPWERESDKANQVYEATCHEGNYGLLGMLANTRAAERLFKAGKGPNPALQDNATAGEGAGGIER